MACFDGVYPVELPEPELLGKHLLERARRCRCRRDRPESLAGGGAGRRARPTAERSATERPCATAERPRRLRGRRSLHRGRRQRRRADEGLGREGPPPRGARRHRRVRRALRRQRAQGATTGRCSRPRADGVGTKVAIAQAMDVHDTIGFDLVGMLVDDLVVCGAEPLFLTDYIATGRVVPERIAAIVKGIAEACVEAGCALSAARPPSTPGCWSRTTTTSPGATTGVVEASQLLGPGRVRPGDVVVAMASSGLHSNGYSLVRHVLLGDRGRRRLDPRPGRRRARSHARRGAARARPGSTPGPASTSPATPGPTRWRTSPAAGWRPTSPVSCPPRSRRPRPRHLDAAAGLRRCCASRGRPRGPREDAQLRSRDGRGRRPGRRRQGRRAARRPRGAVLGRR